MMIPVVAAFALAHGAAGATDSASMTVTGVHYTLVDLDLGDGIAASLTRTAPTSTQATVNLTQNGVNTTAFSTTPDAHGTVQESIQASTYGGAASLTGDFTVPGGMMSMSASSMTQALRSQASGGGIQGSGGNPFLLSANTEIIISGHADVTVTSQGNPLGGFDYADAVVTASVGLDRYDADPHLASVGVAVGDSRGTANTTQSLSQDFSVTFSNTTAQAAEIVMSVDEFAWSLAPRVVPEPAGIALMATGLAGIGLSAFRRRAR